MLKIFAVLVLVRFCTAGRIADDEIFCAVEANGTVEVLQNYRINHVFDEEDHTLKCMVKCTLFKESIIQDNGVLDVEAAANFVMSSGHAQQVSRDQIVKMLRQCDNVDVEGDACVKGFAVGECIQNLKKKRTN